MPDAISDNGRGGNGTRGLFRPSEEDFRRILNQAPFGIFQCTPDRLLAVSQRLAEWLGWTTADEMLADSMFCADFLVACDFVGEEPSMKDVDRRVDLRRKDGSAFNARLSLRPVCGPSGALRFFQGFIDDLSALENLEQDVREAREMAMRGQLAGGIAHDFNNILAGTLIHLGLLLQDPELPERFKEGLEVMRRETERAADLTRQLLSFRRRKSAALAPLDLNQLIEGLLRMLRQLARENILVIFLPAKEECRINADARLIEMLLMHACMLARHALWHGGTLTLATSASPAEAAPAGSSVCLSITQSRPVTGEKTPRKTGATAIWPGSSPAREDELSLMTMKEIVALHHGEMEMPGRFDRDAAYRIVFPVAARALETAPISGSPEEVPGGGETILLIEDERYLRRMTALSLRKLGYAVLEAGDDEEAMKVWDKHREKVDLVFTDFLLPGSSTGIELARRMEQEKPSLKLLVCSGQGADFEASIAGAGGGILHISKPYTSAGLAHALRQCLDQPRPAAQPA